MSTTKITDASFESDVLKAPGPVLVDFWAEWCGPCKMIAPALEDLANELGEKVTVAKLNIDENPKTPGQFGVRGIPTLMLFKDGKVAATKIGALPKGALYQWVESVLYSTLFPVPWPGDISRSGPARLPQDRGS